MAKVRTIEEVRVYFAKPNGQKPALPTISQWIKDAEARDELQLIDLDKIDRHLSKTRSSYCKAREEILSRAQAEAAADTGNGHRESYVAPQVSLKEQLLLAQIRTEEAKAGKAERELAVLDKQLVPKDEIVPLIGRVIAEHCQNLDASHRAIADLANPAEPERARKELEKFIDDHIRMLDRRIMEVIGQFYDIDATD